MASALTDRQRDDMLKRQLKRAPSRPQPPMDVKLVDNQISWTEPQDKAGITHYVVRSAVDVGNIRHKMPVGATQCPASIGDSRFFVSSLNETSGMESTLAMVESPDGKVGLRYSIRGVTVEILNGYDDAYTPDYGMSVSRDADSDERVFITPNTISMNAADAKYRVALTSSGTDGGRIIINDGVAASPLGEFWVTGADSGQLDLRGPFPAVKLHGAGAEVNLNDDQCQLRPNELGFWDDDVTTPDRMVDLSWSSGAGGYLRLNDADGSQAAKLYVENVFTAFNGVLDLAGTSPRIDIGGNKVLGSRGTMASFGGSVSGFDITLVTASSTTVTMSGTADATYSSTEQDMLNAALTDITSLAADTSTIFGDLQNFELVCESLGANVAALSEWVMALEAQLGTSGHGAVAFT